jgi:hypothetical protein
LERPLIHSSESQTAWPTKRLVGLAKEKPAPTAEVARRELSRSAVWLRRDSSAGENHLKALQSSPLKMRG